MPMTLTDKQDFVQWHNSRMIELSYPPEIINELVTCRDRWLASVPTQRDPHAEVPSED